MKTEDRSATAEAILSVTEDLVRQGGYHAASFRDVATRVGIKSASIHYHFPTKESLGVALVRRYLDRTLEFLGDPAAANTTPQSLLARYVDMFRDALIREKRPCLCAMVNAEAAGLPPSVRDAAGEFSRAHVEWLAQVLTRAGTPPEKVRATAWLAMSALQGALALSLALDDVSVFDDVAGALGRVWSGDGQV